MATTPRVSYRKVPGGYEALIKRGSAIEWACGHVHCNRDQTTSRGMSARECGQRKADGNIHLDERGRLVNYVGTPIRVSAELLKPIYRYSFSFTVGHGASTRFIHTDQPGTPFKILGFSSGQVHAELPGGGFGLLPKSWVQPHWDASIPREVKDAFHALSDEESGYGNLLTPPSDGYGSEPSKHQEAATS